MLDVLFPWLKKREKNPEIEREKAIYEAPKAAERIKMKLTAAQMAQKGVSPDEMIPQVAEAVRRLRAQKKPVDVVAQVNRFVQDTPPWEKAAQETVKKGLQAGVKAFDWLMREVT